ncbi:MAG: pyridoxamine 5'-phosphate oxidase family protein [Parvularcula sp.]|jgi:general stress protein 26|nr:pyridoxamine 5'-phosphate oxidase family protein [Parvularcula sp.]
MVDLNETRNHPQKQFFEELEKARAGMLHLQGSQLHSQPMSAQTRDGGKSVYFFAKTDSELFEEMKKGHDMAHLVVVGKDHDYHACAVGHIRENKDPALVDELWNPMVAAWYEGGKEDPTMTLLELDLENGRVWGSTDNSLRFGWETAKANLVEEETPDVGVQTDVTFH